eukprot:gene6746-10911_t
MSRFRTESTLKKRKKSIVSGIVDIIDAGIDAAFEETAHVIAEKGTNKQGISIEFTPEEVDKTSKIMGWFSFASDWSITKDLLNAFVRELTLHGQQFVVQPNFQGVTHNYPNWTDFTNDTFYGRSLPEIKDQYTMNIDEKERKEIIDIWLNRYPRLKIQESDSESLKKQKQNLINQIPHSVKVGETVFTRKDFIEDDSTNYLLGAFAQWFVEQAFKTGTDIHARTGIESMNEEEFKRQWGHNKIDASNIYGSNDTITDALRLKKDGKMKVQKVKVGEYVCDFLPKITWKTEDIKEDEVPQSIVQMYYPKEWSKEQAEKEIYAIGHPRFNLHFGLVFIGTLFIREHNSIAELLKDENPDWDDERIFQTTRLNVIAVLSKMVVEDYIQHILTSKNIKLAYEPEIFFGTDFQYQERAHFEFNYLYRWHSMVPTHFKLGGENFKFADLQFNSHIVQELGLEQITKDITTQNIGRLGLDNTPDFLKYVEITTLLHSRILKTESFVEYKQFFEGKEIRDFSDITRDKVTQKKLKDLYGEVENVDYYVGLLAEDHDHMVGDLMQMQLAIYALTAIFSNPICSPKIWKKETFSPKGWERIHNTRLSGFINRNMQENGFKPFVNPKNIPDYDCFAGFNPEFSIPQTDSKTEKEIRKRSIDKAEEKWPVNYKSLPIRLDDSHANLKFIINTMIQNHSTVLAKRQLKQIFSTLVVAKKTPNALLSTFKTQFDIILSVLSTTEHPYLTDHEADQLIAAMDELVLFKDYNNIIDKTYGFVSKYFSNYDTTHLQNFNWNKDETFGNLFVNGLDPTQITKLTEADLQNDFIEFNKKEVISYFESRFKKKKFKDELKKGKLYYVDNFETMSYVKTNPTNVARPRCLFYVDPNDNLVPIGIQLNYKHKAILKITVNHGQNLKKMDIFGKSDPWVKIEVGNRTHHKTKSTKIQYNTLDPVWNETFEFQTLPGDNIQFTVKDHDLLKDDFMGEFSIYVSELQEGISTLDFNVSTGGVINVTFDCSALKSDSEQRVILPNHTNWTIAKLYVSNAFCVHHEVVSHNLKTHSVMEAVSICVHHTLFKGHPIYGLLVPHLYYTDVINLLARKTLLKDDGTGLVSILFSCGVDGYKINDNFFKQFDFESYIFPEAIKKKDIQIPNYYYAKDGMKIWDAIHKYVSKIVNNFYADFGVVEKDYELQAFLKMLIDRIPGMLKVKSIEDLIKLLSGFIFNSTAMHTVLHYSQLDQLSFSPLMPTILNEPPPLFDDHSFGNVKDGYTLDARQQRILLRYLPTLGQSIMIGATFYPVTRPTDTPLISMKYNSFHEEPSQGYFKEFIADVTKVSDEIKNDPTRKHYDYFSKNAQSINY